MDTAGRGGELPGDNRPTGVPTPQPAPPASKRQQDQRIGLLVALAVAGIVAVVTTGTFYWVRELVVGNELRQERAVKQTLAAGGYYPGKTEQRDDQGNITQIGFGSAASLQKITLAEPNFPGPNSNIQSWLGADAWNYANQQAGEYVQKYPQPQNVQILKGMTTQQIWTYMQQHVSGALGVSCQYCHNLAPGPDGVANFGAEGGYEQYNKKVSARAMLLLVGDVNKQYVANGVLPGWKGNYVNCATCHNGQPKGMAAYPQQYFELIPNHNGLDYKQVIDQEIIYDYEVAQEGKPIEGRPNVPVNQGELSLTYPGGPTQDAVWLNSYSMYTMGWSLGVGCNYCHNSRNFVSYEIVQKIKAQRMLLMTTWFKQNWDKYGAQAGPDGKVVLPGCYTCHNGAGVPYAAMNQSYLNTLTPEQQTIALPVPLRGLPQN